MPRLTYVVAALLLAGCSDNQRPLEPTDGAAPAPGAPMTSFAAGIDDALDRLIPALADASEAHQLRVALTQLRRQAAAGNAGAALVDARGALARYAEISAADAADVTAIALALDAADWEVAAGR